MAEAQNTWRHALIQDMLMVSTSCRVKTGGYEYTNELLKWGVTLNKSLWTNVVAVTFNITI